MSNSRVFFKPVNLGWVASSDTTQTGPREERVILTMSHNGEEFVSPENPHEGATRAGRAPLSISVVFSQSRDSTLRYLIYISASDLVMQSEDFTLFLRSFNNFDLDHEVKSPKIKIFVSQNFKFLPELENPTQTKMSEILAELHDMFPMSQEVAVAIQQMKLKVPFVVEQESVMSPDRASSASTLLLTPSPRP